MRWVVLLFLGVSLGGFFVPAQAQDTHPAFQYGPGKKPPRQMDFSYKFNPLFDHVVRRIYVTWPRVQNFSFYTLRSYYKRTRQYAPLGEDVIDQLGRYAAEARGASERDVKLQNTDAFQDLVFKHLGHVDAVLLALSFARDDQDFGNPGFYQWVRDGILDDIMSKSDGKSMRDPYILITMGEEALVLSALKVKPVHTELVSDGQDFFHIHLVEDLRTGKRSELYTDVSIPMRRLKRLYYKQQQEQGVSLGIKRQ